MNLMTTPMSDNSTSCPIACPTEEAIVVDRYGYILQTGKTGSSVFLSEGDKMVPLGVLGGEIEIDYIYSNVLQQNATTAKAM
ncbi:MAG: hypothetical protein IJK84_06660 [Bacteroidales bacterium]|nr:hypothetical protein [Bacteroidales bacterium]